MVDPIKVTSLSVTGRSKAPDPNLENVFVTYNANFSVAASYELDFTILNQGQVFGIPRSVFIDNGSNPSQLDVYVSNTDQFFAVPPYATGIFTINAAISSRITFTSAGPAADIVTLTIYNYDVAPSVWFSYGTSSPSSLQQVYGTMAEGANIAAQTYEQPVYIGGIDRATGLFRAVSVDATGIVNVSASFPGVMDVEVQDILGGLIDDVTTVGTITNPVTVRPNNGALTNGSIANLSGASQQLFAANAARRYILIQNIAANSMGVNLVGSAAAIGTAGTITLAAGGSIELTGFAPTAQINIIGTLNDDVTAFEA